MIIWRWTSPLDGLDGLGYAVYGVGAGGLEDGSGSGDPSDDFAWYLDTENHIACDPFRSEGSYDF